MPWAFRNRRAEDLVSLCYKFSAKLLVISRTTQSISGTSLIWRHNNKSSWRNNASLGWGMTTFVYVWLSSVICGTVVPRRWTHSATTPPYSNLGSDNGLTPPRLQAIFWTNDCVNSLMHTASTSWTNWAHGCKSCMKKKQNPFISATWRKTSRPHHFAKRIIKMSLNTSRTVLDSLWSIAWHDST